MSGDSGKRQGQARGGLEKRQRRPRRFGEKATSPRGLGNGRVSRSPVRSGRGATRHVWPVAWIRRPWGRGRSAGLAQDGPGDRAGIGSAPGEAGDAAGAGLDPHGLGIHRPAEPDPDGPADTAGARSDPHGPGDTPALGQVCTAPAMHRPPAQIRTTLAMRWAASTTSGPLSSMSSMTFGNSTVTHASLGPATEGTGAEIAVAW